MSRLPEQRGRSESYFQVIRTENTGVREVQCNHWHGRPLSQWVAITEGERLHEYQQHEP